MNLLLINGIMTQLQGVVPLLTTHCATHLSLTVSQACEVVPCAERFERLVNDMYIFSSHSTTLSKYKNEPKLKLKMATDTKVHSL